MKQLRLFLGNGLQLLGALWLGMGVVITLSGLWGGYLQGGVEGSLALINPLELKNLLALFIAFVPGYGLLRIGCRIKQGCQKSDTSE